MYSVITLRLCWTFWAAFHYHYFHPRIYKVSEDLCCALSNGFSFTFATHLLVTEAACRFVTWGFPEERDLTPRYMPAGLCLPLSLISHHRVDVTRLSRRSSIASAIYASQRHTASCMSWDILNSWKPGSFTLSNILSSLGHMIVEISCANDIKHLSYFRPSGVSVWLTEVPPWTPLSLRFSSP